MRKTLSMHRPRWWLWTILGIYIVVLSSSHTYNDILITAKQSMKFWDLLFEGRFLSFYEETLMLTGNDYYTVPQGCAYPFTIYFIFALWNFPVWLLEKLGNINAYNTIPGMLWQKGMLITFYAGCLVSFRKILECFPEKEEQRDTAVWAFASSVFFFTGTFIASQYDIVNLLFILIGVYGWIRRDKKLFYVAFIIAVSLKYFALLMFLPLLLLREKKVWKVLFKICLLIVPTLLLEMCFTKVSTGSLVGSLLILFFGYQLQLGAMTIPVFFTLVVSGCLWCYLSQSENFQEEMQQAVFALLLILGAFAALTDAFPYWLVLTVPFFVLGVFFSNGNENKAMLCETVVCGCIVVRQYAAYSWVSGVRTVLAMGVIPRLLHIDSSLANPDISQADYLSAIPLYDLFTAYNIFPALMMMAWIMMLIFCFPRQKSNPILEPLSGWTVTLRTFVNAGIALLPLACSVYYFIFKM